MRGLLALGATFLMLTGVAQARSGLTYVTATATSKPTVWLANADGSGPVKLGTAEEPLLSPDGTKVAASLTRNSGAALAVFVPGSATQTYLNASTATASALAWSGDSRYVAVQLFGTAVSGKGSGLAVIDTSAGTTTMISGGSICGASFGPSDRLVYAYAPGSFTCGVRHVNLYTAAPNGHRRKKLTHDGRSLNPVWARHVIVYDRLRDRGKSKAPAYQLWTIAPNGHHRTQITNLKIPPLLDGLVPVAVSANGRRLLAQYEGEDTSEAWTVSLRSHRAREVKIDGQTVLAGGISRDGRSLLVDFGGFMQPASHGTIESVPFGGGPATALVAHGASPSWNR